MKLKKYLRKSRAAEGAQYCLLLSLQKLFDLGRVKCVKAESQRNIVLGISAVFCLLTSRRLEGKVLENLKKKCICSLRKEF